MPTGTRDGERQRHRRGTVSSERGRHALDDERKRRLAVEERLAEVAAGGVARRSGRTATGSGSLRPSACAEHRPVGLGRLRHDQGDRVAARVEDREGDQRDARCRRRRSGARRRTRNADTAPPPLEPPQLLRLGRRRARATRRGAPRTATFFEMPSVSYCVHRKMRRRLLADHAAGSARRSACACGWSTVERASSMSLSSPSTRA